MSKIKALLIGFFLLTLASCTCDHIEPEIDSIWINMEPYTKEKVVCAYPNQTITIYGCGFKTLKKLIVNSEEIELSSLTDYIYLSDNFITFNLPEHISTNGDYVRVVTDYGLADYSFRVLPLRLQPVIPDFIPEFECGTVSRIYGSNLEGAYEITLPLKSGDMLTMDCIYREITDEKDQLEEVLFTLPEGTELGTGRYMIQMKKHDSRRGIDYIEKVYSPVISL